MSFWSAAAVDTYLLVCVFCCRLLLVLSKLVCLCVLSFMSDATAVFLNSCEGFDPTTDR